MNYFELKKMLLSNEINWRDVIDKIQSMRFRPWDSKAWKEKRILLIGSFCEECGSNDNPLVLQHTKQPLRVEYIINDFQRMYDEEFNKWKELHSIIIDESLYPQDTDACPKCRSQVIRYRKTLRNWMCESRITGDKCGFVFDTPVKEVNKRILSDLYRKEKDEQIFKFIEYKGFGQQVAIIALNEIIEYLELKNVKTLCKKCAYLEDINRIEAKRPYKLY